MLHTSLILAWMPLCLGGGERVTFTTDDDQVIVADFYPVQGDGPTVICLPMLGGSRTSYEPLARSLNDAGIQMLSLDLRGHGESAPELAAEIEGRALEPFLEMHRDVAAALDFLASRGSDTSRVALIGASIGCSVSVDSVVRDPSAFRSVVLLTPGPNYLGMDTMAHLQSWPGTPCLILSATDETPRSDPIANAMAAAFEESTRYDIIDGTGMHGTQMFGKADGIENRIAGFFAETLSRPDLRIPHFSEDDPRANTAGFVRQTLRLVRKLPAADGTEPQFTLMAFAIGETLTLGAMVHQDFAGLVGWEIGETTLGFDWDTKDQGPVPVRVEGAELEAVGQRGSFRGIHWVNVELPLSMLGDDGTALRLRFSSPDGPNLALPSGTEAFAARLSSR
jgi:pimeloyl-ACP methyl ester carboxylesterase